MLKSLFLHSYPGRPITTLRMHTAAQLLSDASAQPPGSADTSSSLCTSSSLGCWHSALLKGATSRHTLSASFFCMAIIRQSTTCADPAAAACCWHYLFTLANSNILLQYTAFRMCRVPRPLGTHVGGGHISATQSQGIAGALITSGTRCCKAYIEHRTLCTSMSGMPERYVSTLHRFRALQGQEQSPNCVSPRHVIYICLYAPTLGKLK